MGAFPRGRLSPRGLKRLAAAAVCGVLAAAAALVGEGRWIRDRAKDALYFAHVQRHGPPRQDPAVCASLEGRRIFPADNPWNKPIDQETVDPRSAAYLSTIGLTRSLHPDFGVHHTGKVYGIPYVVVDRGTPRVPIFFMQYPEESDPGPYPIPLDAPIEGGGDRHVLAVERDEWKLYELYAAHPRTDRWEVGCGATFDLSSNRLRPKGRTSADAAGLPILPGLVRYDEVFERGEINHAVRFTAPRTQKAFVHPARHHAGHTRDPDYPPMGMRVRLKAGFDTRPFPRHVQVLLRALKRHGMILADNGGPWFITGTADARWPHGAFTRLRNVRGQDLEVVKTGVGGRELGVGGRESGVGSRGSVGGGIPQR